MGTKTLQLSEFIQKYSVDGASLDKLFALDQDLVRPGFQNPNFKAEEIVADYNALSAGDRYIVFNIFSKRGDIELMKQIVDCEAPQSSNLYPLLAGGIDPWKEKLVDQVKKGADVWAIRLGLAEGLFKYDTMLAAMQEVYIAEQKPATDIAGIRLHVFNKLKGLYGDMQPKDGSGSIYWDTDGDFSPYVSLASMEIYFDHKDADPLDVYVNQDNDGDGVTDSADAGDADPNVWSHMAPATMLKTKRFDVVRAQDGSHTILLRIYLKPAEGSGNTLAEMLGDQELLDKTAASIEDYFQEHLEKGASGLALDIQFVNDAAAAHQVVEVSDDNKFRACSIKWRAATLSQPYVMTHEVMHLLGLPDRYHEGLVDGKLRDHTLAPGFVMIDPMNLMSQESDTSVIRASQVKTIIALASLYEVKKQPPKDKPADGPIPVEKIWGNKLKQPPSKTDILKTSVDFQWNEIVTFHGEIPKEDLEETFKEVEVFAKQYPKDQGLQIALVRSAYLCGKVELVNKLLTALLKKSWHSSDGFTIGDVAEIAFKMGRREEAMAFLKQHSGSAAYVAEVYLDRLYESGDTAKLYAAVKVLAKKWPKSYVVHKYLALVAADKGDLAETGKELEQADKLSEFWGGGTEFIVEYLIKQGRISEAYKLYSTEMETYTVNDTNDRRLVLCSFAVMLCDAGRYSEAVGYFKEAGVKFFEPDKSRTRWGQHQYQYIEALKKTN